MESGTLRWAQRSRSATVSARHSTIGSSPGDTTVYDDDFGEFETRILLETWGASEPGLAIELDPEHAMARCNLGHALVQRRQQRAVDPVQRLDLQKDRLDLPTRVTRARIGIHATHTLPHMLWAAFGRQFCIFM